MHPETLHQLMHRLSAEGRVLSWGVESRLRQRLRDMSRTIACLGQGPDPLTEERVVTQVLGTAHGAGDDARRGPAPDPFDGDLQAFAGPCAGHHHVLDDLSDNVFPFG